MDSVAVILEPKGFIDIEGEEDEKQQCQVKEIPVQVLQDQWQSALAPVTLTRFADGARRGIGPKRFVIGSAIIIASDAETARRPQDQQGGRKDQPAGPPGRLRTEPAMCRVA